MRLLASILAGFVALQHFAFMILEMFFWTKPLGLKVFKQSLEQAEVSKTLAANQGLYNGFLAVGLVWALLLADHQHSQKNRLFFLACVVVAGIYGGITAKPTIFFVQAVPAIIALALTAISKPVNELDSLSATKASE